jgi:DNA-binding CsgD family transcriptional regulator
MVPRVCFLREDAAVRSVVSDTVPPLCHVEAVDSVHNLSIEAEYPHGIVLSAPHDRVVRSLVEEHHNLLVCVLCPTFSGAALSRAADRIFLASVGTARTTMTRFVHALCPVLTELERAVSAYANRLGLSRAEARVLALAVAGHTPEGTATRLGVSVRTVEGQLASIRQKSGVKTMHRVLVDVVWFVAQEGARRFPS